MARKNALHVFSQDWGKLDVIKLHLKGTEFRVKVAALVSNPVAFFLPSQGH